VPNFMLPTRVRTLSDARRVTDIYGSEAVRSLEAAEVASALAKRAFISCSMMAKMVGAMAGKLHAFQGREASQQADANAARGVRNQMGALQRELVEAQRKAGEADSLSRTVSEQANDLNELRSGHVPACQGCALAQRRLQTEKDKRAVNKLQLATTKANLKAAQDKLDSLLSHLPPQAQAEEPAEASESESDDEDL